MSALPSITEPASGPAKAEVGALYERYSGRIFGYCLRRLPSREEAEDAVQNTFLNAFRGLRQGVVPRSELAWLFKIAENVCRERRRSAWRRNRVETTHDPDGLANLAVAPVRSHDELAGFADALAELPPNQQRAILLREWQGLSYREIAAQLELTEGAVETLLFRARRSLARKLDRSRGRHWGVDAASLGAWGKSLSGGAAAKVAATVAVVATVAVATPAVRHELVSAPTARQQPRSQSSFAASAAQRPATTSRPRPKAHRHSPSRPSAPAKRQAPGTVPGTRPVTSRPAPAAPAATTTSPPTPTAPPVTPPQLPPVSTPKAPPLPVQAPQTPPLPSVTTPDLPTVPVPTLPKLP